MHVTVARISHELAQWQSERAAQNDKIDTPAGKASIGRHRRPICWSDSVVGDVIKIFGKLKVLLCN